MKKMKFWQKAIFGIIGLGIIYEVITCSLIIKEMKKAPPKNADTLIVLGAQVWGQKPSSAYPSPVFCERLDAAVKYLKSNPKTQIITSGGKGSNEVISEAKCAKNYLISKGIAAKRITLEDKSKTTIENLRNSKANAFGSVVIVTNDFHVYRAKLFAKRLGYKNVDFLPAVSKTSATPRLFFRETIAVGYHLIKR